MFSTFSEHFFNKWHNLFNDSFGTLIPSTAMNSNYCHAPSMWLHACCEQREEMRPCKDDRMPIFYSQFEPDPYWSDDFCEDDRHTYVPYKLILARPTYAAPNPENPEVELMASIFCRRNCTGRAGIWRIRSREVPSLSLSASNKPWIYCTPWRPSKLLPFLPWSQVRWPLRQTMLLKVWLWLTISTTFVWIFLAHSCTELRLL